MLPKLRLYQDNIINPLPHCAIGGISADRKTPTLFMIRDVDHYAHPQCNGGALNVMT
jgi:hypothetical protein